VLNEVISAYAGGVYRGQGVFRDELSELERADVTARTNGGDEFGKAGYQALNESDNKGFRHMCYLWSRRLRAWVAAFCRSFSS